VIFKCGRAEIWHSEVRVVLYIHNCCWFSLFFRQPKVINP